MLSRRLTKRSNFLSVGSLTKLVPARLPASLLILLLATCLSCLAAPSDQRAKRSVEENFESLMSEYQLGQQPEWSEELEHKVEPKKELAKRPNQGAEDAVGPAGVPRLSVDDVKRLCKDKKVQVEYVDQMKLAILLVSASAGQPDELCADRYLSSFTELDAILKVPARELCSPGTLDLIKSYHFRFISPLRQVNRRPSQFDPLPREIVRGQLHPEPGAYSVQLDEYGNPLMIPIGVRHFFLKFALQLSGHCKSQMLVNLAADSQRLLNEDDFAIIDLFNKETPIGEMLAGDMSDLDFDTALYLPELEGERNPGDAEQLSRRVYLKTSMSNEELDADGDGQTSSLSALIQACQTRFKPIYQRLIMPVIHMVKLGYDYQGDYLTKEERIALTSEQLKSWLAIVHICELFDRVVLVKDTQSGPGEQTEPISEAGAQQQPTPGAGDKQGLEQPLEEDEDPLDTGVSVSEISSSEMDKLAQEGKLELLEADKNAVILYEPSETFEMSAKLWIEDERQLDLELSKKRGNKNPFGFMGFLRRTGKWLSKQLAKLDLNRFAHYRRNALWYSGVLNFISALSNIASIGVSISSMAGG